MKQEHFHPMRHAKRHPLVREALRNRREGYDGPSSAAYSRRRAQALMDSLKREGLSGRAFIDRAEAFAPELIASDRDLSEAFGSFSDGGRLILAATPALESSLARTSRMGRWTLPGLPMPAESVHVSFSGMLPFPYLPAGPGRVDGIYLSRTANGLDALFTAKWEGVHRKAWPLDDDPTSPFDIPTDMARGLGLEVAIGCCLKPDPGILEVNRRHWMMRYDEESVADAAMVRTTHEEGAATTLRYAVDLAFCIVAHAALNPSDGEDRWPDDAPAALVEAADGEGRGAAKARSALAAAGHMPFRRFGRRLQEVEGMPQPHGLAPIH